MKKSKAEQRVALARDVLKQIMLKRIKPTYGEYLGGGLPGKACDFLHNSLGGDYYENGKLDMRGLLKGEFAGEKCNVCAKGALFLSHILVNDKVTLNEFASVRLSSPSLGDNPIPEFTPRQLDEIEVLFEGMSFVRTAKSYSQSKRAKLSAVVGQLDQTCHSPKERLASIMKLIIKNKGRKIVL